MLSPMSTAQGQQTEAAPSLATMRLAVSQALVAPAPTFSIVPTTSPEVGGWVGYEAGVGHISGLG